MGHHHDYCQALNYYQTVKKNVKRRRCPTYQAYCGRGARKWRCNTHCSTFGSLLLSVSLGSPDDNDGDDDDGHHHCIIQCGTIDVDVGVDAYDEDNDINDNDNDDDDDDA